MLYLFFFYISMLCNIIICISSYNLLKSETIVNSIEDKEEYNYIKQEINKILLTIKNKTEKL